MEHGEHFGYYDLPPKYTAWPFKNVFDHQKATKDEEQDRRALIPTSRFQDELSSINLISNLEFLHGPMLARGLQVPFRANHVILNFKYPLLFKRANIDKIQ